MFWESFFFKFKNSFPILIFSVLLNARLKIIYKKPIIKYNDMELNENIFFFFLNLSAFFFKPNPH